MSRHIGFEDGLKLGIMIEVARAISNQDGHEHEHEHEHDDSRELVETVVENNFPDEFGFAWIWCMIKLLAIVAFKIVCFFAVIYAIIRLTIWYFF